MKQYQKGFTLIEMLVAMAIFTALISVLMLGFRQGLLMWEKGQQQSSVWQGYEFRYRLLDTLISQAVVSDSQTKNPGLFLPYFHGTQTSMQLISSAPIMDVPGRVRPLDIRATQSADGSWKLDYREGERYSDASRGLRWNAAWVTLLSGLKSVSFSFEAPANPMPPELDVRFMSKDERMLYREAPEWMMQYDIYQIWRYPQSVALDFVDGSDVSHHWLFVPPRSPDAWTMEVYEGS